MSWLGGKSEERVDQKREGAAEGGRSDTVSPRDNANSDLRDFRVGLE